MSEPTPATAPASAPQIEETFEISWSPTIAEIVKALAKAQLAYKPVLKQNENEAFTRGTRKSYYADLATYIDATQKALAENGLVVIQWPTVATSAESMSLISILAHTSGEWMRGKLTLPAGGRSGFTPQSCGSSITYARRYSYAAITGCAAEDDDGNAASGQGTAKAAQEVADKKIAELRAKKAVNGSNTQQQPISTLFYTEPPSHNGHFAEFINIREFLADHQDLEDSVRMAFTAHKAKKTKADTALVPSEELLPLLEQLTGDIGLTIKKLDSNA
jgi:hypothetical protein